MTWDHWADGRQADEESNQWSYDAGFSGSSSSNVGTQDEGHSKWKNHHEGQGWSSGEGPKSPWWVSWAQDAEGPRGSKPKPAWTGDCSGKEKSAWSEDSSRKQWKEAWEEERGKRKTDWSDDRRQPKRRYHPGEQVTYHNLVLDPQCGSRPKYTLMFFHALSHGPEDALLFLPYLWDAGLDPSEWRIVAPCSPMRRDRNRWKLNMWFRYTTDMCWKGKADCVDYYELVEQRQRLLQILEEEHQRLGPGGKIILGGLSQGVSMALDVMLHAPPHLTKIAGVWCCRGMLQKETLFDLPETQVQHRSQTCPVFVYHGKADGTVPFRVARDSYSWLTENGFQVQTSYEKHVNHSAESFKEYRVVADFVAQTVSSLR